MYQKILSHNEDLKKLKAEGYALDFTTDRGYLIVRDIPYLNNAGELHSGIILAQMISVDKTDKFKQLDHQVVFIGSTPHGLNEQPIPGLHPRPFKPFDIGDQYKDMVKNTWQQLSNKPLGGGYKDFYDKILSYVTIISGPAMKKYQNATYKTYGEPLNVNPGLSPFQIPDILSTRTCTSDLSEKFKNDVIAIIGLGGTGSYVLDFIAKTPVKEIRLFDSDIFEKHTLFRSPGKFSDEEIEKYKVDVYKSRYQNIKTGIDVYTKPVDASAKDDLKGITFAFVCVDNKSARAEISDLLISLGIPFIDTGIGMNRCANGSLLGSARTTYLSTDVNQIAENKKFLHLDVDNNEGKNLYKTDIQIAEVNALNACMAVIRYKQSKGYYYEDPSPSYYHVFETGGIHCIGDKDKN